MNPATKIALAALAVLVVGVALVAHGSGAMHSRSGEIVTGLAITWAALAVFAAIWRAR